MKTKTWLAPYIPAFRSKAGFVFTCLFLIFVFPVLWIDLRGKGPDDWTANSYACDQASLKFKGKKVATLILGYTEDRINSNQGIYTVRYRSPGHTGLMHIRYKGWNKFELLDMAEK